MQLSPWSFALAGGPAAEGGYPAGRRRRSDEVVAFDQENYAWEARSWGAKVVVVVVVVEEKVEVGGSKKGKGLKNSD